MSSPHSRPRWKPKRPLLMKVRLLQPPDPVSCGVWCKLRRFRSWVTRAFTSSEAQRVGRGPTDRYGTQAALADPYFAGLSQPAREPSAQPVSKMAFEFERRKLQVDDVRPQELTSAPFNPEMRDKRSLD